VPVDTPVQQQVQHWQRIRREADINLLIVDSRAKPVNPLLGALDERFRWDASKKLQREVILNNDSILLELIALLAPREGNRHFTRHPGYAERSPPGTFAFNERKNKRIEYTFPGCGALICAFHFRIEYRSASLPLAGVQLPKILTA
jgi:hypothetical protein